MHGTVIQSIPIRPESVLFWTGAGISIDPPSCLPSGVKLTEEIVDAFCLPNTWKILTSLIEKAEFTDSSREIKKIPRLEALLGNIASILGYSTLRRFSSLLDPVPNSLHLFFAQHIKAHGKHITLNLDIGIENAIKCLYNDLHSPWILHLHGRFDDNPSDLGLTFENIAKGLSENVANKILDAIHAADVIIFAGYSGSDVFDVNPFFASLIGQHDLSQKTIIWIDHNKMTLGEELYGESKKNLLILDALSQYGAKTYVWKGPTSSFLDELRRRWSFSDYHPPFSLQCSVPSFDKNVLEWQKHLITAKILVSMGAGKEALEALHGQDSLNLAYSEYCKGQLGLEEMSPSNKLLYILNEAHRELGLYKNASRITKRFCAQTDLDMMLIYERRASDYWLSGSWWAARKVFLQALEYGSSRLGKSYRFDTIYVETLRAYMQLCRDIGRIWLLGKCSMKKDIVYPIELISTNKHLQDILRRTPYDRSHIARLVVWEGEALGAINEKLPSFLFDDTYIVSVFGETDNVLGIINTRRSKLRSQLSQGLIVQPKKVEKLLELSRSIGDNPGVVKACCLLASLGIFNKRTLVLFANSLMRTQWTYRRKLFEAIRFLGHISHGLLLSLTKRCTGRAKTARR